MPTQWRGLSDLFIRLVCGPQSLSGRRESEQTELEVGHPDWTKYVGQGSELCVGSRWPKLLGPIYRGPSRGFGDRETPCLIGTVR